MMSQKTGIEWTDRSSNPLRYRDATGKDVWACVKVSPGCVNCYSESLALQYGKGKEFTAANMRGLIPYVREKELKELLSAKKTPPGSRCFICDMTDLFGDWVPFELVHEVFAVITKRPDVTFQILTKRPDRMADFFSHLLCPDNAWLGTSVENQKAADERIPHLLRCPAKVRFLSCEPLLGAVSLSAWFPRRPLDRDPWEDKCYDEELARQPNWVIVGGESGSGHRPMEVAWAEDIVRQCDAAGVKVFTKQDSGSRPGKQGRLPLSLWERKEFPAS